LLDRFGLTVEIAAPRDPDLRAEVVRRRLAFDRNPETFGEGYAESEGELQRRIVTARALLDSVRVPDQQLRVIAEVCAAFEVDGMRADIVTARAAAAHAAWDGRDEVTRADIRAAARLALPHRRRRNPFDAPGLDEDLLDRLLGSDEPEPEPPTPPPHRDDAAENGQQPPDSDHSEPGPAPPADPDSAPADPAQPEPQPVGESATGTPKARGTNGTGQVAAAAAIYRARLLTATGVGAGEPGRRSRALTSTGRTVGSLRAGQTAGPLHLSATIRAAAPHQSGRGRSPVGRLRLVSDDLRLAVTEGRESNLVLLVVDASGSMAARRRMEAVKAAALSLLLDAYQRRDKVGLITFRGAEATLSLPPTSSVDVAARRLQELPSGGRTPLAEGLLCAAETLDRERIRDPRRRPLLVLVTDGRATHGPDAVRRSRLVADRLRTSGVASVVIDCETGRFALGLAGVLSARLGAQHLRVADLAADQVLTAVRQHTPGPYGRVA
jgi:magnesium chelatase subunit D